MTNVFYPVWKQWNGHINTVVLFTGQVSGLQYYEDGTLGEEMDHWIQIDSDKWIDIEPPIMSPEALEIVERIRMRAMKVKVESENEKNKVALIQEDRQNDYGDAEESFESIANYWSNYLSRLTGKHIKLDATDVAFMMVLFKVSRNSYKRKLDNVVDCASYADFGLKFMQEKENGISF